VLGRTGRHDVLVEATGFGTSVHQIRGGRVLSLRGNRDRLRGTLRLPCAAEVVEVDIPRHPALAVFGPLFAGADVDPVALAAAAGTTPRPWTNACDGRGRSGPRAADPGSGRQMSAVADVSLPPGGQPPGGAVPQQCGRFLVPEPYRSPTLLRNGGSSSPSVLCDVIRRVGASRAGACRFRFRPRAVCPRVECP
jgi:hypothetical protein